MEFQTAFEGLRPFPKRRVLQAKQAGFLRVLKVILKLIFIFQNLIVYQERLRQRDQLRAALSRGRQTSQKDDVQSPSGAPWLINQSNHQSINQ